jgi:hypothetical protein
LFGQIGTYRKERLVNESLDVEMPRAWEDAAGWDLYYRAMAAEERESRARDDALRYLGLLMEVGSQRPEGLSAIWVAGCGCTALGRMLSQVGVNAHATDVSAAAVAWQKSDALRAIAAEMTQSLWEPGEARANEGAFVAKVHDFREPYMADAFDIVFNCKAMQGFVPAVQRAVARTHFAATRAQGHAIFATQNVQGTDRDELEAALAEAGFYVPLLRANRWHRQVLRETGIPHAFILGQPMIRWTGEYAENKALRERDTATLRSFGTEHQARCEREWEETRAERESETVRTGHVIYNTG